MNIAHAMNCLLNLQLSGPISCLDGLRSPKPLLWHQKCLAVFYSSFLNIISYAHLEKFIAALSTNLVVRSEM